jgi:hypothetical protein
MLIRTRHRKSRRGAAIVEMAIGFILMFMMMVGIFEYCRLLFVMHVSNNAARDAARFAAVKTGGGTMPGEPTSITKANIETIALTGAFNGTFVGTGMCGMQHNIENLVIEVFAVDPAGLAESPAVVRELTGTAWNNGAFSDKIAVRISGNYRPVLPNLLFMSSSVPFSVTVYASSEAN